MQRWFDWLRRFSRQSGGPKAPGGPRRRVRRAPEVQRLEPRELLTIIRTQTTVAARPPVLQPTGGYAVVTVVGQVASTRDALPAGFFEVTDQYRQFEPHGDVTLVPLGPSGGYYRFGFEFNIRLPAQARTNTPSGGRQFFILVGATDQDSTDGQTTTVFIPGTVSPIRGPAASARFLRGARPPR